ncbi:hypothetical protein A2382_01510 [Candidatus Woesebacteria bacterium RIFOXYB1_FULL_38_16]|uniref:Uncharacterized protein n=1 Tax=Candidatus Woesebacteria bacterium RIFOXYB1_FULL_38_16 TaxID=1802538 RepID=A0A1F8CRV6_9BACT|nr:MAG: hypothetical protein A2191_01725 [Candidatus Woesebacteria bacterium RIFOXYA1_FULL_38_9]OGM79073.1 MAG: hypothetical protein A2382_01510 [Candidatus Woesebacteria bacterium RIFOXYB1_FULL_38_16]
MDYLALLVFEIWSLGFMSQRMHLLFLNFLLRVLKSKKWTVVVYSLIFLPGTFIHELSHLVTAQILGVPTGPLNLLPSATEGEIRLGSVSVARSGMVSRFLIGTAPFLVGAGLMFGFIYFLAGDSIDLNIWVLILGWYVVFELANTMFLSRSDLEGAWGVIVLIIGILITGWIFGFGWGLGEGEIVGQIVRLWSQFLLVPIGIQFVLIIILRFI